MADEYFSRPEISNSDLTSLKKYWQPISQYIDIQTAYRFGTLIDCLITEPDRVNVFERTCGEYSYSPAEMETAQQMLKAFYRDPFCQLIAQQSEMQRVTINPSFAINMGSFQFAIPARCKWDFFGKGIDMAGDLKSTACTTQKQFADSLDYFDYDRQAAWYLDLEPPKNKFMFIGISKVNFQIFKVPLIRGDKLYGKGKEKYQDISFKWWSLFNHWQNNYS